MADCTGVGVNGKNGIVLKNGTIPSGVICFLSGYLQSANGQTATVKNSSNTQVAQISAAGNTNGATMGMAAPFTSDGNAYTIYLTNTGNQDS